MEPTADTKAAVAAEIGDDRIRSLFVAVDDLVAAALVHRATDVWRGTMWGGTEQAIVGRGRIVQSRPRGKKAQWFLVGVAAQSAYVSVYVNAVLDGEYLLHSYADRLGRVKLGPASITIRDVRHLEIDVFNQMLADADGLAGPDAW